MNKKFPLVSVIILNCNGKGFLRKCVSSVLNMTYPKNRLEVILVDNASVDGSVDFVKKNFPTVKILALDKNYGFSEGNNRGAKFAAGEYLAFLSNDTYVDKGWISELVKFVDDKTVACASKVIFMRKGIEHRINSAGLFWTIFGNAGETGIFEKDRGQYDEPKEVLAPHGCAFFIKKSIYQKLGGMDSDHFIYVEDLDLGWKVWNLGYRVMYVPKAIIYHFHSGSVTRERLIFNQFLTTKNSFMVMMKNSDILTLLKMLPLFLFQRLALVLYYSISGSPAEGLAIMKGLFWIIGNMGLIAKKRRMFKQTGTVNKFMYGPAQSLKMFMRWRKYSIDY